MDPTPTFETMMVGRTAYWVNGSPLHKDCDNFQITTITPSRRDSNYHAAAHGMENTLSYVFNGSFMNYNTRNIQSAADFDSLTPALAATRTCKSPHTYRRTDWNISDNDASFYKHQIQFSGLIGGEDGNFEHFHEFVDDSENPLNIVSDKLSIENLLTAIGKLDKPDRDLITVLFFDEKPEREVATELGISQQAVNKKKQQIIAKLKALMEI